MLKSVVLLSGGLCIAAWASAGCGQAEPLAKPSATGQVTATGQVLCLACYARDKENTRMDHDRGRDCAWACVRWEGQPVGLLTADGTVYQLAGDLVADSNAKIAPHLAHTVTVTGDVGEKDGMLMLVASDLTTAK